MNYFLGIDIAKTNHVASLINNTGDVVIRAIKFTNSIEGFDKLLSTIQDKLGDLSNFEVAMEASGHYWFSLYSALTDNNFNVSAINGSPNVTLLQISREKCLQHNYHKAINSGGIYFSRNSNKYAWTLLFLGTWRYLTSWDKSLLYFSVFNQNHSFVWFLEEDVFIPDVQVLRSLHQLYANACPHQAARWQTLQQCRHQ